MAEEKKSLLHSKGLLADEVRQLKAVVEHRETEISQLQVELGKAVDLKLQINSQLAAKVEQCDSLEQASHQLRVEARDLKATIDQKSLEVIRLQQFAYLAEEVANLRLELENRTLEYQQICEERANALDLGKRLSSLLARLAATTGASLGPYIEARDYVGLGH